MASFKQGSVVFTEKATPVAPSNPGEISVVARGGELYKFDGVTETILGGVTGLGSAAYEDVATDIPVTSLDIVSYTAPYTTITNSGNYSVDNLITNGVLDIDDTASANANEIYYIKNNSGAATPTLIYYRGVSYPSNIPDGEIWKVTTDPMMGSIMEFVQVSKFNFGTATGTQLPKRNDPVFTKVDNLETYVSGELSDYTLLTTTASISGSLEASKQNNITLVAGDNITIVESPTDTWTIRGLENTYHPLVSWDFSKVPCNNIGYLPFGFTFTNCTASISGNFLSIIPTTNDAYMVAPCKIKPKLGLQFLHFVYKYPSNGIYANCQLYLDHGSGMVYTDLISLPGGSNTWTSVMIPIEFTSTSNVSSIRVDIANQSNPNQFCLKQLSIIELGVEEYGNMSTVSWTAGEGDTDKLILQGATSNSIYYITAVDSSNNSWSYVGLVAAPSSNTIRSANLSIFIDGADVYLRNADRIYGNTVYVHIKKLPGVPR